MKNAFINTITLDDNNNIPYGLYYTAKPSVGYLSLSQDFLEVNPIQFLLDCPDLQQFLLDPTYGQAVYDSWTEQGILTPTQSGFQIQGRLVGLQDTLATVAINDTIVKQLSLFPNDSTTSMITFEQSQQTMLLRDFIRDIVRKDLSGDVESIVRAITHPDSLNHESKTLSNTIRSYFFENINEVFFREEDLKSDFYTPNHHFAEQTNRIVHELRSRLDLNDAVSNQILNRYEQRIAVVIESDALKMEKKVNSQRAAGVMDRFSPRRKV